MKLANVSNERDSMAPISITRAYETNESHAKNKKKLVTDSFQLLFLIYKPWILFQGLLHIIEVGFR